MNTLHTIFDWLIAASLRASLLTLVVFLLQAALRRHLTARMHHALWLPVLIVLLMPVFPQSRWSVETVFAKPPQPVQITSAPIDFSPGALPVDHSPPLPQPEPIDWQRIFIMAWLTGAFGILLFGSISFIITLRRFKLSRHPVSDELTITLAQIAREVRLRRVPRVWIASAIHSPAVTGFLRPTLLLPAQFDRYFTPAEARLVLKHELMHLKRHDLPLNAVLCVLMALHWFNPLLWLAFFKARLDREAACDAQVLQNDSADCRREYGHTLLKVETAFCPRGLSLGFVGIFQRGAALRSRIRYIATHRQPHPIMKTTVILAVPLLAFFGMTTAAPPDEDAPQVHIVARFVEFPEGTITFAPPLDASAKTPGVLGVLTDPQLQLLLRQMSSTKGVDLMSAPSVNTQSGREARIEVCREFAYRDEGGQDATKKVGVMLTLLPTISGDSQIDLGLSPQIVELEGMAKTSGGTEQPVFSDRKTKQSVVMTAGQTVVLEMPSKTDTQTVIDRALFKTTRKKVVTVRRTVLLATASLIDKRGKPSPSTKSLQDKLKSIILPSVQFRNAKISDCIDYFRAVSKKLDTATTDPAQRGVNILLRAGGDTDSATINLDLKNVPLIEALRETAELTSLQMIIRPYAVTIEPPNTKTEKKTETALKTAEANLAEKIILPTVEFQDAKLADCLDFIRIKSRDLDPGKKGVNIIVKPGGDETARITLSLKNVPVSEALRYSAELANHKLTFDAQSYFLTPVSTEAPPNKDQASSPASPPPASAAEAKAAELRKASSKQYDFTRAKLGDVLQILTTDAGLNFFSLPPDDNPINQKLVTFSIRSSPFRVLEVLCWANGLIVVFDHDHWFIRPANDSEQFMKIYFPPKTKAGIETILKDISSVLSGSENKPSEDTPQPSVVFKENENSFYVKATRLQHTWISAYFQGLSSSAQPAKTK